MTIRLDLTERGGGGASMTIVTRFRSSPSPPVGARRVRREVRCWFRGDDSPRITMRLSETDRLEAFSDGVMAVIITIMAFSIPPPDGSSAGALRGLLPHLLVYVLSFAVVGIYWNNHHHLLRATEKIGGSVMWANLFLLFCLSLFPIVTAWVGRFPRHSVPAMSYGLVGLAAGLAYTILVRMIIRVNGSDSAVGRSVGGDAKGYASLVLYASGMLLAFVSPWIAYGLYAGVAVMWFIPDRRLAVDTGG